MRDAEIILFEAADLVAQAPGFLELEVGGGLAHALLEVRDVGLEVVTDEVRPLFVAGTGFRAGEIVRVTASADEGFGAKSAEAGRTIR